jgi:hypothetical protein
MGRVQLDGDGQLRLALYILKRRRIQYPWYFGIVKIILVTGTDAIAYNRCRVAVRRERLSLSPDWLVHRRDSAEATISFSTAQYAGAHNWR